MKELEIPNTMELIPRKSLWKQFREQYYSPQLHRKVVAEAISTYLLVFMTAGSAAISGSDETKVSPLGASIAGGLIVTVMIYAVGHISGAFMNPAVTVAFASIGHLPWKQVPFYAAAQFTGSVLAAFTLRILLHPIKRLGTTSPSGSEIQSLIMEIVVTFAMMFIATAVTIDTKATRALAGVAVGSAVCITSIFAGPVSGGSMNPARTLGPAIASNYYHGLWVYFLGPVVGTLLAAWSYRFVWTKDKPVKATSVMSTIDGQDMPVQAISVSSNDDHEVTADDTLNPFKRKVHQIEPALDYPSGYQSSYVV